MRLERLKRDLCQERRSTDLPNWNPREDQLRVTKATSTVQPDYMEGRFRQGRLQEGERAPCEGLPHQWEDQWQEFLKTMQPVNAGETDLVMLEAVPWDDTKAFLASFEQVANACRWPVGEWVARLLPALSGEMEEAFRSLDTQDKEDYGKVKTMILRKDALRMEKQRQHFRDFSCQEVEDPRWLHSQVQELCHRWLRPERRSKEQILELLILEQFLASLPPDVQGWIRAGGPDTCSQAVALVDDFLVSQQQKQKGKWEGPLKEECLDFLEAEGKPSNPAKGQLCKEVEPNGDVGIRVSGSAMKYPSQSSSFLPPKGQEVVQTGVKEEPVDRKETIPPAQRDCQSRPQPSQPTVVWKVLQEASGSMDFLGDEAGSQLKVENSQWGGDQINVPEADAWTIPPRSQGNVLDMCEEGCEPQEEQGKLTLKTEEEFDELPGALTSIVSQLASSAAHKREEMLFTAPGREDHERCPLSVEAFPQSSFSSKHQRMIVGGNEAGLSEHGVKSHLDGHQSHQVEETPEKSLAHGRSFSYTPLQSNQGIQNEGRPYECSFCRKCFGQREHLMNHRQLHTGEKLHECPECGKIFTSRQALRRHQGIHTLVKPYKCSQCGKSFSQRRNLTIHQRIHTGEKPYKCPECGKRFSRTQCLKNHQRIHTGDKPHQCSQCGKCFNQRRYLKNHQRIHTGLKPYECPQCGKCFSMVEYLKNHQRIHTGVKPYQCSHCGKSYIQKVALISHQRSHSREKSKDSLHVENASVMENI
uniref:Uncharacterized protein n=1 Tax=Pogona vitticeps TaxID=103695 RepID=A0A6J0SBQ7_9SAUR